MALTELTENLNSIQSLSDQPAMPSTELKQQFDRAGNIIKDYINETLLPELNSIISTLEASGSTYQAEINSLQNIVNNITTNMETINSAITTIQNTLSTLKSGATTKISVGSGVPSTLEEGEIYLQYFS